MIHVGIGASATASLKSVFHRLGHLIIEIPIDFSVGPIKQIHNKRGVSARADWIVHSFNPTRERFNQHAELYMNSLETLQNIRIGEKVTIWTCSNAAEQIGLRISCFLLADKQVELNMVNTQYAMNECLKGLELQQTIRHSGECSGKQLAHFYRYSSVRMTEKMRNAFEKDGAKLLHSSSLLRSWRENEIAEDEETREDAFIVDCIKNNLAQSPESEYVDAIRIVGEVLGLSEQTLSDMWIDYRIRSLIQNGKLAYQGNLHSMLSYKVKVTR
ncbi:DUF1835 domain-containing protein [Planococcus soli]|uniref:DUF1835 domain-containing protein n=1 Tax=Planococcus soli TaxID=2666072 RepID=UPI00115D54B4|nr:DUF1835 domain-containing protein [Planococcus soli]